MTGTTNVLACRKFNSDAFSNIPRNKRSKNLSYKYEVSLAKKGDISEPYRKNQTIASLFLTIIVLAGLGLMLGVASASAEPRCRASCFKDFKSENTTFRVISLCGPRAPVLYNSDYLRAHCTKLPRFRLPPSLVETHPFGLPECGRICRMADLDSTEPLKVEKIVNCHPPTSERFGSFFYDEMDLCSEMKPITENFETGEVLPVTSEGIFTSSPPQTSSSEFIHFPTTLTSCAEKVDDFMNQTFLAPEKINSLGDFIKKLGDFMGQNLSSVEAQQNLSDCITKEVGARPTSLIDFLLKEDRPIPDPSPHFDLPKGDLPEDLAERSNDTEEEVSATTSPPPFSNSTEITKYEGNGQAGMTTLAIVATTIGVVAAIIVTCGAMAPLLAVGGTGVGLGLAATAAGSGSSAASAARGTGSKGQGGRNSGRGNRGRKSDRGKSRRCDPTRVFKKEVFNTARSKGIAKITQLGCHLLAKNLAKSFLIIGSPNSIKFLGKPIEMVINVTTEEAISTFEKIFMYKGRIIDPLIDFFNSSITYFAEEFPSQINSLKYNIESFESLTKTAEDCYKEVGVELKNFNETAHVFFKDIIENKIPFIFSCERAIVGMFSSTACFFVFYILIKGIKERLASRKRRSEILHLLEMISRRSVRVITTKNKDRVMATEPKRVRNADINLSRF